MPFPVKRDRTLLGLMRWVVGSGWGCDPLHVKTGRRALLVPDPRGLKERVAPIRST
jgi:hypothetical protein